MEIGVTERLSGFEQEVDEILEALRRRYFWGHLIADFLAGICFVAGSVLFFYPDLVYAGTWLFLFGSILFAAKPTIRLIHQLHRARVGNAVRASAGAEQS